MEVGFKPTLAISRRIRFGMRALPADYLLEKNPSARTMIKVDVEGKGLRIADF